MTYIIYIICYICNTFFKDENFVRRSRIMWRRCDSRQRLLEKYRMFSFRKWIRESINSHPHCRWRIPIYRNYSMEQVINEISTLNSIIIARIALTCALYPIINLITILVKILSIKTEKKMNLINYPELFILSW